MNRIAFAALLAILPDAYASAPTLSALEHHVRAYHQGAREALREGGACFVEDEKRWESQVRRVCGNDTCRGTAYLDRLAELHALQPGVTAIRHFVLPARPALLWIVPPAPDKVAAPPNPKAAAAQVEGTILDELSAGDGFVLRTAKGERYLLAMLMFLEGATAQRLSLMATEPGSRFIARGHLSPARGKTRAFEPSRCLFIYRALS